MGDNRTFLVLLFLVGTYYLRVIQTSSCIGCRPAKKRPLRNARAESGRHWTILLILLPAFDTRFGWSQVTAPACVAGLLLMLAAYAVVIWVFQNEPLRVAHHRDPGRPDRHLVGPSTLVVRHPMYQPRSS